DDGRELYARPQAGGLRRGTRPHGGRAGAGLAGGAAIRGQCYRRRDQAGADGGERAGDRVEAHARRPQGDRRDHPAPGHPARVIGSYAGSALSATIRWTTAAGRGPACSAWTANSICETSETPTKAVLTPCMLSAKRIASSAILMPNSSASGT